MTVEQPRVVDWPAAAQLERARQVVSAALPPTPLVESPRLGAGGGLLKLESLQPTGAFKVRGALSALDALEPDTPVVTASSGNHALATAWAAQRTGRRATVVVPETTSPAKLDALRRFYDDVVTVGDAFEVAERHAIAMAGDGMHYLSPYNDPAVIAGQATIGAELEHLDGPLTVVVPIGGGGLISGIALWARQRGDVRVVGVEVEASQAMRAALEAGRIVPVQFGPSLADSLTGNIEPGSVTFSIVQAHLDDLVTVSEDDVAAAMRFLVAEHGVVAEGAGAVGVAAILAGLVEAHGRPIALITGRNVTAAVMSDILRA
jgi:threonine dehydratase